MGFFWYCCCCCCLFLFSSSGWFFYLRSENSFYCEPKEKKKIFVPIFSWVPESHSHLHWILYRNGGIGNRRCRIWGSKEENKSNIYIYFMYRHIKSQKKTCLRNKIDREYWKMLITFETKKTAIAHCSIL